jgi:hypothetical protein
MASGNAFTTLTIAGTDCLKKDGIKNWCEARSIFLRATELEAARVTLEGVVEAIIERQIFLPSAVRYSVKLLKSVERFLGVAALDRAVREIDTTPYQADQLKDRRGVARLNASKPANGIKNRAPGTIGCQRSQ